MSRDINNTKQNRKLESIQRRYDEEDDESFKALLDTPDGRQIVCRLARNCGWMGEGWDANSARMTDFNAGKRSTALDFMAWAERVAPDDFHLMLREASLRDKAMNEVKAAATIEKDDDNG